MPPPRILILMFPGAFDGCTCIQAIKTASRTAHKQKLGRHPYILCTF